MGGSAHDLARFLGPRPGQVYVYGLLDDGSRDGGSTLAVSGLGEEASGVLLVREEHGIAWKPSTDGRMTTAVESRLRLDERGLVQTAPDGDLVLIGAPLQVGTLWTRPVWGYTAELGRWRREMTCRIAMIDSVPVFGETRLTVRVVGRAQLPLGEVVLIEQYAAGIGLVLRREHVADFGPSETVLEEIREATPA